MEDSHVIFVLLGPLYFRIRYCFYKILAAGMELVLTLLILFHLNLKTIGCWKSWQLWRSFLVVEK